MTCTSWFQKPNLLNIMNLYLSINLMVYQPTDLLSNTPANKVFS